MATFDVGEVVDVRSYGRAEVIEPLVTEPGARFYGRIRIRYQSDGKTYYARPENLRKTVQVTQRVLLCHSTTHYRTCAASVVNWGDAVLEVGSHEGECTWLLSRRCRYIVGVDKSPATVAAARRRYPGLRFEEVDGFDVPALKALGPPDGSGFSVVLVDIGGIASLSTVAALVGLYYKEFPYNTKIVVKSVFLKRMVENCLPYNPEKNNPWTLRTPGDSASGGGGRGGGPGRSVGVPAISGHAGERTTQDFTTRPVGTQPEDEEVGAEECAREGDSSGDGRLGPAMGPRWRDALPPTALGRRERRRNRGRGGRGGEGASVAACEASQRGQRGGWTRSGPAAQQDLSGGEVDGSQTDSDIATVGANEPPREGLIQGTASDSAQPCQIGAPAHGTDIAATE